MIEYDRQLNTCQQKFKKETRDAFIGGALLRVSETIPLGAEGSLATFSDDCTGVTAYSCGLEK